MAGSLRNTFNKEQISSNGFLKNIEQLTESMYETVKSGLEVIVDNIHRSQKIKKRNVATKAERDTSKSTGLIHKELEIHTALLTSINENLMKQNEHHTNQTTLFNTNKTKVPEKNDKSNFLDNLIHAGPALKDLGKGLLILSGGIVAFGLALTIVNPVIAGVMLLSAFILGKVIQVFADVTKKVDIKKTSIGIALLGVGVAAFGLSLWAISKMEFDPIKILGVTGGLLLFTGVIWLMGKVGFENIVKGSLTMGVMAIGLVAFSLGFWASTKLLGGDWSNMLVNLGMFSVGVLAVGAVFAIAGLAVEFIALGALSMVAMGIGMVAFSYGVKKVQELKIDDDAGQKIGTTLKNVFGAFGDIKILDLITATLALPAMIAVGSGLTILASGVKSFAELESKYKIDYETLGINIGTLLGTIGTVFAKIGSEFGGANSILGMLVGNDFGKTPVERGIASVRDLGTVLNSLADGVGKWANLDKNFPNLNYEMISGNIYKVLSITKDVFAKIGGEYENNNSIIGLLFGRDFGRTPVERGIASVRDLGTVLDTLANGISKWTNLDKNFPNLNYQKISDNISTVLNITTDVFKNIGLQSNTRDNLLSFITGIEFGNTPVEKGIASVRDLGKVLNNLADGIGKWANLDKNFPDLNYETISTHMTDVLTLTSNVFANIGKTSGTSLLSLLVGKDGGSTDVERGIASVRDLGTVLNSLADGIIKWNDLTTIKDKDGKTIGINTVDIANNIESVLTVLPEVFKRIGSDNKNSSWWQISTDMEKGMDLAVELSKKLNMVAESVMKFNGLQQPATMFDQLAKSYERISIAIQKMPMPTLTKLNDLFYNHYKVISVTQSNDSLLQLIQSLKDVLLQQDNKTNAYNNPNATAIPFVPQIVPVQKQVSNKMDNTEIVDAINSLMAQQTNTTSAINALRTLFDNGTAKVIVKDRS